MNHLPLPDEIIRKIYQFIHPAFEYEKYLRALTMHDEERTCFMNIIHNNLYTQDLDGRINFNDIISSYSLLMNDSLLQILEFIGNNNRFIRPYKRTQLRLWQFKTAWQYQYEENHVYEIDNKLMSESGHERTGRGKNLLHILKIGRISELMYSCIENNIDIYDIDYTHRGKNDINVRNRLVKKLMSI